MLLTLMRVIRSLKGLIGRLALVGIGVVFLAAGALKALDPAGFTEQVAGYGILPAWAAAPAAYLLILLEIALGAALLLDYRRLPAVVVAVALLVGFLGLMGYTWAAGGDVGECGCFGRFVERTPAEAILEDLAFIAVALLGLAAPPRGESGGRLRAGGVAAATAVAAAFVPVAPALPLDGIVTGLKPGVALEDLRLSLPDGSLARGRHLVALLALKEDASGRAADELNALATRPGAPPVAAIYADEEEVKDAFFWAHAPSYPMHQVVHGEMRRLYRRLPRFFLLEDGIVKAVWEDVPSADVLIASAQASPAGGEVVE